MELILKEARSTDEKEKNMKDEKIKILCCDTGVKSHKIAVVLRS